MKKLFFFIVLLAGASFTIQAQAVLIVDNNQGAGAPYTTVQSAINAAQPGDHIYVQPSPNNYDNINMTKPLNIYSIGYNPELNAGQRAYISSITFNGAAGGSKISGLHIHNINFNYAFNNHGVVITNNRIDGTITGNSATNRANDIVISGNFSYHDNSQFIYNYNSQNWIITNNLYEHTSTYHSYTFFNALNSTTIFNNNIIKTRADGTSSSIQVFLNCNGAEIKNNIFIFTGNSLTNMNLGGNTALLFQNNLTWGVQTSLDPLSGTNNIDDTDPLFTSFSSSNSLNNTTHDYTFQGGSPAINAGADGNDLGVMNGGFPFNLRGYPTELPYLTDFVINNNILSEGTPLNINVKADANNN